MSEQDETAPVEIDETPVAEDAAPAENGTPAPESESFEKRYNDLRTEFNEQRALRDRARQGDPEAIKQLTGFEFATSEEEPGYTDDEEQEPLTALEQRQAAIEEWAQQQQAQEGINRFNTDLDGLLAEKKLTLSQRDRLAVFTETVQRGDSPDALKSVVDEIAAERAAYDKQVIDGYFKQKKNAPHVSAAGTGATEEVLPLDAKHRDRVAHMAEKLRLANEQH